MRRGTSPVIQQRIREMASMGASSPEIRDQLFVEFAEHTPSERTVRNVVAKMLLGPSPVTILLGNTVRDRHTGFTGLATARMEQLYGVTRIQVEGPLDREGKVQAAQWFDEPRIEVVRDGTKRVGFNG